MVEEFVEGLKGRLRVSVRLQLTRLTKIINKNGTVAR